MRRGRGESPWNQAAAEAKPAGIQAGRHKALLAFNEPDMQGQADMTPEKSLAIWPQLEATGLRLGSPAPAGWPEGWLKKFMQGAKQAGRRVDFLALHWYGDVNELDAVEQLRGLLRSAWEAWQLPIWLTEFSGPGFPWFPRPCTLAGNARFARDACLMLDSLPYVERYA